MKKKMLVLLVAAFCSVLPTHALAAESLKKPFVTASTVINNIDDNSNQTRSIEMDVVQSKNCAYNLTVQLSSRIFGIGTPIHYRYESIISKTLIINSSSGGNYIVPTSAITHELSNNDQICTVTFYGDVKNAAGTTIISNLKLSVEFDANEAQ